MLKTFYCRALGHSERSKHFHFSQNYRNIQGSFVQGGVIQPGAQVNNQQTPVRQTRSANVPPATSVQEAPPAAAPVKVSVSLEH